MIAAPGSCDDDGMFGVPESRTWWANVPGGVELLAALPDIVAACSERWQITVGEPFTDGVVSLVLPATRRDGSEAVLKVPFPDVESRHEPDGLAFWDGRGAARLLARDGEGGAFLVERLRPGTPLLERPDEEATNVIADVVAALHRRPSAEHPFALLTEVAAAWAVTIPRRWERLQRPFERELVDEAVAICLAAGDGGEPVVLHQDLHAGNVLRDGSGWRAIDPKPLLGDAAFDLASALRDRRPLPADEVDAVVRRRLDTFVRALGYERDRMRRWGIAHALAWGVDEDGVDDAMVACARALLRAG
jgi:streptomycin 6-kinase